MFQRKIGTSTLHYYQYFYHKLKRDAKYDKLLTLLKNSKKYLFEGFHQIEKLEDDIQSILANQIHLSWKRQGLPPEEIQKKDESLRRKYVFTSNSEIFIHIPEEQRRYSGTLMLKELKSQSFTPQKV